MLQNHLEQPRQRITYQDNYRMEKSQCVRVRQLNTAINLSDLWCVA